MKCPQQTKQATERDTSPQNSDKGHVYAWQIGGTYGKAGEKSRILFLVWNICATEEAAGTEPAVAMLSAKTGAVLDIFITLLVWVQYSAVSRDLQPMCLMLVTSYHGTLRREGVIECPLLKLCSSGYLAICKFKSWEWMNECVFVQYR